MNNKACACVIFCFLIMLYSIYFLNISSNLTCLKNHNVLHFTRMVNQDESLNNKIVILYWTKYFGTNPLEYILNSSVNKECLTNCVIVCERSHFNMSDAIIFHSTDLRKKDMPLTHPGNQIWVYLQQESPIWGKTNLKKYGDVFNWTMTYRQDSDVRHSYFRILEEPTDPNRRLNMDQLHRKTKLVAWLVSHCRTHSKREEYVKELKRFIPVDIYGKCGDLACPRVGSGCWPRIGEEYKFYLAFENALCEDYITEKFSNPLRYNLVPVVMGGGDYKSIAPTGSFINVDDFNSPEELAKYLYYLHDNPDKYMEYFQWQQWYRVEDENGFCLLCEKLVQQKQFKVYNRVYHDLWKWWFYSKENVEGIYGSTLPFVSKSTGNQSVNINTSQKQACHPPTKWGATNLTI